MSAKFGPDDPVQIEAFQFVYLPYFVDINRHDRVLDGSGVVTDVFDLSNQRYYSVKVDDTRTLYHEDELSKLKS